MPSALPARLDIRQPHTLHPWLRAVGRAHVSRAAPAGLHAHVHHGAWEICWIERGRLDWYVGAEACRMDAEEVMVTHPDEEHGARHAVLEPCDLWWIQFEDPHPDQPPALRALLVALARAPRRFAGVPGLTGSWRAILDGLVAPDAWTEFIVRGRIEELCALLGRCAKSPPPRPSPSPAVARCLAWASARRAWSIPVAALAHQAGMSPARLHARFRAEVGATPAEWLRARRLTEAYRLLGRTRLGIGVIAQRLGYVSSQQFAHAFRRVVGVTPSAWRKEERRREVGEAGTHIASPADPEGCPR